MVPVNAFAVAAAALLAALPVHAGLYTKNSPVIQVDGRNYDRLIGQSNYTSIVEFYAPWCGHCKNLQPAYEKAAKNLAGLAKVAAVDCDEESNKQFCGNFGIQGFPTLKIIKPGKTPGKPIVEDYNGARSAKGIVDAVVDKIPNHVTKVEDKTLEQWLANANDSVKVILFTDKGKTSALLKAVAIEFKGSINVAQIRDNQKASVELFGITKTPTLLLLPGGKEAEGVVFEGDLNKASILEFLTKSTSITPNQDPAPPKVKLPKSTKSKDSKKASKQKEEFESASSSHAKEEGSTAAATATEEVLDEEATPSPDPIVEAEKPVVLPSPAPQIPSISSLGEFTSHCLGPKTSTCILALVAGSQDGAEVAAHAVGSLSQVAHLHRSAGRKLFPFYSLPEGVEGYSKLKAALKLDDTAIVAINARRGWWRRLPVEGEVLAEGDVSEQAVEAWVDSIRLGEGAKEKLPEGLVPDEPVVEEATQEPAAEEGAPVVEEEKPIVVEEVHDEL